MNILDALANDAQVQWRIARIKRIYVGPPYNVDLVIGTNTEAEDTISTILGAAVLGTYAPVVNQVVHVLVHTRIGALVLGPVRTAAPVVPVVLPTDLPRMSQFYGGNAPYNVTTTDAGAKQNLGGTTFTNPDTTRWILCRGDVSSWSTTGVDVSGYLYPFVSGASAALTINDHRMNEEQYESQVGAMMFTVAPGATVTFRAQAYRSTTNAAFSVNYLRATVTPINWRPNGSI